jgi:hypothetical protein
VRWQFLWIESCGSVSRYCQCSGRCQRHRKHKRIVAGNDELAEGSESAAASGDVMGKPALAGTRVLIVEDDFLIAEDLKNGWRQ